MATREEIEGDGTQIIWKRYLAIVLIIDLIAVVGAMLMGETPAELFDEGEVMTFFSAIQLIAIHRITRRVFLNSSENRINLKDIKKGYFIWYLISMGFLFLTVDEILLIHENIDEVIHWILGMKETALTDRIDDIVVGCYGLVGLAVIYYYRDEMKKYKEALPYLIAGFILFFLSVCLDILTNREDILPMFNIDHSLFLWLNGLEEGFKTIAEGVFIGTAFKCYEISNLLRKNS
jgi:hypothetical protein